LPAASASRVKRGCLTARLRDVLHVHRAERADGLVEALRALGVGPLSDPFAPEVIAVPTRGM
jgi:hypothetical protein